MRAGRPTMLRFAGSAVAFALAGLLVASAVRADAPPCPSGTELMTEYRLFFGRNQGTVEAVSEEEWRAFLTDEITPRFPDGLTVLDAAGQWRDASGTVIRERTKLLIVLAPPGESGLRLTDEVAEAYKRDFEQESVLRSITTACVSF